MAIRVISLILAVLVTVMVLTMGIVAIAFTDTETSGNVDALNASADMQVSFAWFDMYYYILVTNAYDMETLAAVKEGMDEYSVYFEECMSYYEPLIINEDIWAMYNNLALLYYESYKPCMYTFLEDLQRGVPYEYTQGLRDELDYYSGDIEDALSELRALEYERLNGGQFQGEADSTGSKLILVAVLSLALLPALGMVGVTIAGVASESKRRKQEQAWQQPYPPQYGYVQPPPMYYPEPTPALNPEPEIENNKE